MHTLSTPHPRHACRYVWNMLSHRSRPQERASNLASRLKILIWVLLTYHIGFSMALDPGHRFFGHLSHHEKKGTPSSHEKKGTPSSHEKTQERASNLASRLKILIWVLLTYHIGFSMALDPGHRFFGHLSHHEKKATPSSHEKKGTPSSHEKKGTPSSYDRISQVSSENRSSSSCTIISYLS